MIRSYINDSNIYLMFNDLDKEVLTHIQKLKIDNKIKDKIKEFLIINQLNNNLFRQKNYLSNITTYIEVVDRYNLFIYIIPKEIKIVNYQNLSNEQFFKQIESLSIQIFILYKQLCKTNKTELRLFKEYKGENILDLKINFYIKKLNLLYNNLLNYKKDSKLKIICSDKIIGIEIEELNYKENNPLKNYQFVKEHHQKDLVVFIYNLIKFLENKRFILFKNHPKYKKLKNILNKINNFLFKISKIIKKEKINSLRYFFDKYKKSKEIKKNQKIYQILEEIFFNELHEQSVFFESIDLTKLFEKIVEKKLSHYENLYIGDENIGKIYSKSGNEIKNNILIKTPKIRQYPDFIIIEKGIYHIIDAKYKLRKDIFKNRDIFWQILIYAKLFNKYKNPKQVKKIIIYPEECKIDISHKFQLSLNLTKLNIYNNETLQENAFDSRIKLIKINILKIKKFDNTTTHN